MLDIDTAIILGSILLATAMGLGAIRAMFREYV